MKHRLVATAKAVGYAILFLFGLVVWLFDPWAIPW